MSMPPALGIGAARAPAGGYRVGCAGPAAPREHRHRDLSPAENRCSRVIPGVGAGGLRGRGSSGGDGFAGQRVGGGGAAMGGQKQLGQGVGG